MNWKKASGYNRRALVEAMLSRYKRIIEPGLKSRHPAVQHNEAMIDVDILNQMFDLGRPVTKKPDKHPKLAGDNGGRLDAG